MLVGRSKSVRPRVARVLALTAGVTLAGVALAAGGAAAGLWPWPPPPSGPAGVACGFAGGAIVLFEMLLLPRKWFRGRRLGATRLWMRWHVWLGLVGLPVVVVHSGFGFGGPLPAATLALFLLVTASGVWGLVMQQWLPQKMLADIPDETVATEADFAIKGHVVETVRLVEELILATPHAEGAGKAAAPLARAAATELLAFRDGQLIPYLERGRRSRSALAGRSAAERRFARLRSLLPAGAGPAVRRLEHLCDLRRQWDALGRLHVWLHNWQLVHLPLSVAMTVLMVAHAFRALKYW